MSLVRRIQSVIALMLIFGSGGEIAVGQDPLADLQAAASATKAVNQDRAYHFGSQGAGKQFSNHTSHTNRLIPVYVFGKKADLASVTGANSRYRSPERVKELYGFLPENTVNKEAQYCDQADLYKVQKDAVARGAKHVFIVWFDGLDWDTTLAGAIVKTGKVPYTEGKGNGLIFQDYQANGTAQYGFFVTSPTHDKNTPDVDKQTVSIPASSLGGGYDALIAGANPWKLGPLGDKAPGYLKGSSADDRDEAGVKAVGRVLHAYTDSSQSAGEFATGVKAYNNGVNVTDDGRFVPTLFATLQQDGWKVGTVTSVPFDHVSPAAMYAHNVHRDDFQDIGREMLGLPSISQSTTKDHAHPGLDVVIGTGYGVVAKQSDLKKQGKNATSGNMYLSDSDFESINAKNGGKYHVVHKQAGVNGGTALKSAASKAAEKNLRLFGFFGAKEYGHLPYRTANGDFKPVAGITGKAEAYSTEELDENPTLADMTEAAITTLSASKKPFALFVEAGDVDWALHDNNLDNAVGALFSGEDAVKSIINWVEKNSNWDDSVLIVTADHGHYLVIDKPASLLGK
jgi:alkaline phosphatase